jgi:ArsR family transcriptional regulator
MQNKADLFPDRLAALAAHAKALSHPARLAILQTLAQRGTCVCGEVVDVLPLAQATVSQHLRTLRDAGLVRGEVEGPCTCYCIDADALRALADNFGTFVNALTADAPDGAAPDCC